MMIDTLSPQNARARRSAARVLAVAGTVAAALVTWVVVAKVCGVDLTVHDGDGGTRVVGPGSVAVVALVSAVLGWGGLALIERISRRVPPGTLFAANASVALLLSLTGPLTDGSTGSAKAGLSVLHVVTAAVLVVGLARTARCPAGRPRETCDR